MTRLARLSMANRALVALASVLVALFGVISAVQLRQELIPDLEIPILVVVTSSPGASPDVLDSQVSQPVATAVADVDGLSSTSSTSSSGLSIVQLELDYGTDLDAAQQQVQSSLARISAQLPTGAQPQVIAGSIDDLPVVQLSVTSDLDPQALSQALQAQAVPQLTGLDGVRDVTVSGAAAQRVVIDVDPARLAASGSSAADITTALQANGVVVPAGTVADGDRTLSVSVGTRLASVDDLRALPLSPTTTLADVADVSQGEAPTTSIARTNGEPSLALAVTKAPDGNTVDVSHAVSDALPGIASAIGSNTRFGTVFDQAPFIEQSVHDLTSEGLLGLGFAIIVILIFLLSWRSTLVTALSIPLSVVVVFIGLRVGGYSLNILTLGALTVAIGRVVDDSIVVIENVNRHLSYGEPKRTAILT
ncbi:MAG: efflux RND transporter permease subunit, partial [Janthinobacterium lividum]